MKDENENVCLDFTAEHRMTNPRHCRISLNGEITHLEMYRECYGFDSDIPGDKEKQEKEYYAHNRKVSQILIKKGLSDKRK
ncbi:hypothetical protein [uncultured Kordia sp.]|uniref:hypothetical protein n=1 Tax=uncultured Kordia sp. TaxID=507699 RepID=UPI0026338875|nr:hypothetical protein [uncultured Kordia sp.]